jgi:ubiquinone/menaquinone biosynthesis C-methylase UbiE
VTATDILTTALDYARRVPPVDERLRLVCADVERLPFRDQAFDYVTCALFFHHLIDAQIISALKAFDRLATRGIVVTISCGRAVPTLDLALHEAVPSHPASRRPAVDSPVAEADEMQQLASAAGLPWLTVRRHFGHRMTLAGQK